MKLLLCLSAFTVVYTIRVPNSWADNNYRPRNVGHRIATKRNLDRNPGTFSRPVITNDGWIPLVPKNAIKTNHKPYRRPTVAAPSKFQNVPYRKYPSDRKPRQFPKKYAHNKNVGAIQQPYVVFNPFVQNENRLVLSTPRPRSNFEHQLFPSPSPVFNPARTAPLSNNRQNSASINNFLQNLNVDQYLNGPQQQHPKRVNVPPQSNNPSFENFEVESVFNDVPKNHKPQYTPIQQQLQNARTPPPINFRDDKSHEPFGVDASFDINFDREQIPTVDRKTGETAPISSHEVVQDIPTKPIYPGEGVWAKKGQKHRPHVSKHQFENLKESKVEPDGYEVFKQGQVRFDAKRNKFYDQLNNFPIAHKLEGGIETNNGQYHAEVDHENQEGSTKEENKEEFVPTRLYAQVRNSENEEHLPSELGEDGRLKEYIKDSKVQTVYSEEGYEDSAYDHAGHEKKAQDSQDFEETDKELEKDAKEKSAKKKKVKKPLTQEELNERRLPTDEEIELDKQKELSLPEDSNIDYSEYVPVISEKNGKSSGKYPKKWKKDKNDYRITKETKTTTTMEKGNNNIEMEINGEKRVILHPDDATKAQKYVHIYPTIRKIIVEDPAPVNNEEYPAEISEVAKNDTKENSTEIYIEEVFNHTTPATVIATEVVELPEIINLEIPITTLATTAIPKTTIPDKTIVASESLMNTKYYIVHPKMRTKRSSDDYFPDISPDIGFIDQISHEFGKPKEDMTKIKYPYYYNYQSQGLHENSPLRYAEDMKNIPVKQEGQMAFYNQADSNVICPEIASTVEPIPERVLNAEQEAEDEEEDEGGDEQKRRRREIADSPRLGGLGDKINCLKVRYFGENPLDSPFFKEETVGEVKPIFDLFKNFKSTNQFANVPKIKQDHLVNQPSMKDFNYETAIIVDDNKDNYIEASELNEDKKYHNTGNFQSPDSTLTKTSENKSKIMETTTILNLITTPNYTIELKPKNIYDQIQLLNYLPVEEKINDTAINEVDRKIDEPNNSIEKTTTTEQSKKKQSNDIDSKEKLNPRKPKQIQDSEIKESEVLPEAEQLNQRRRVRKKPKRPMFQIFDINKFLPTTQAPIKLTPPTQPPPMSQKPFRHYYATKRPSFQIFDINSYLPTTTPISIGSPVTVLPKYKVISEVFYKDDIKPNEQLNVFNDVIRNIKSSSEEAQQEEHPSESSDVSETTKSSNAKKKLRKSPHVNSNKKYQSHDSDYDATEIESSTTSRPLRIQILKPYKTRTDIPIYSVPHLQNYKNVDDKRHNLYIALNEAIKKQKLLTTSEIPEVVTKTSKATEVMGLKPPKMQPMKPNSFKRDSNVGVGNFGEPQPKIMNKYLVVGMRPPPVQKIYVYSDFIDSNYLKEKLSHSRVKRGANKPSYAQLSRGRSRQAVTEATTEEAVANDDYVPHRSRNYYYDEKLGKIVYLNTNKPKEDEEEEEMEEIYEIVEEVTHKPTSAPKQNPIFATATPPPDGQSFVDFVKKLKNAANYQEIPDPLPTEQPEETSQIVVSTVKAESTKPPEFLSILSKVKSNNDYKLIEDKTDPPKAASKVSAITEAAEIEEEEAEELEEDEEQTEVQNSSGKQIHEIGRNFEIFDITDYIPKIKNYLPKTGIDTSKYQTIRRPHKSSPEESEENESRQKPVTRVHERVHTNKEDTSTHTQETNQSDDVDIIIPTTEKVIVTTIVRNPTKEEEITEKNVVSTTHTHTENIPRHRGRGRFRNTQPSTTTTTISPTQTHTDYLRANSRRRLSRLRHQPTTEKFDYDDSETKAKIVHRRSDANVKIDISNESADTLGDVDARSKSQEAGDDAKETPAEVVNVKDAGKKDVEIFKEYDKKKLHGGNYRRENGEANDSTDDNDSKESKQKASDVEVVKPFNNKKQTGGGYKDEDEDFIANIDKDDDVKETEQVESKEEDLSAKPTRINLLNLGDEKERNWSHDNIVKKSTQGPRILLSNPKKFGFRPRKQSSQTKHQISRLTDVVHKPETYFKDPNLPSAVNFLIHPNKVTSEEAEEIASTTVESLEDEPEESKTTSESSSSRLANSTKKPLFIKDPSKRLYFYAPI